MMRFIMWCHNWEFGGGSLRQWFLDVLQSVLALPGPSDDSLAFDLRRPILRSKMGF